MKVEGFDGWKCTSFEVAFDMDFLSAVIIRPSEDWSIWQSQSEEKENQYRDGETGSNWWWDCWIVGVQVQEKTPGIHPIVTPPSHLLLIKVLN